MATGRATCRCGQPLEIPGGDATHVTCPACSARVRLVRKPPSGGYPPDEPATSGDGIVRFSCSCGRRLKIALRDRPTHGKCPACGRVVPVPPDALVAAAGSAEAPTADMPVTGRERLDEWTRRHLAGANAAKAAPGNGRDVGVAPDPAPPRAEAGLRVCPQCGKPIHMGADACRTCGIVVPRR